MSFNCKNYKDLNSKSKLFRQKLLKQDSISEKEVEEFTNEILAIEGIGNKNAIVAYITDQFVSTSNAIRLFNPDNYLIKQSLLDNVKPRITDQIIKTSENPAIEVDTDEETNNETGQILDKAVDIDLEVVPFAETNETDTVYTKDTYREVKLFNNPILQLSLFRKMNEFLFKNLFVDIENGVIVDVKNINSKVKEALESIQNKLGEAERKNLLNQLNNPDVVNSKSINQGKITQEGDFYLDYLIRNDFDTIIELFYGKIIKKNNKGVYKLGKVSAPRSTYDTEQGSVSVLESGSSMFKLYMHTTPIYTFDQSTDTWKKTGGYVNPFAAIELFAKLKDKFESNEVIPETKKQLLATIANPDSSIEKDLAYSIYNRFFADENSLASLLATDKYSKPGYEQVMSTLSQSIGSIGRNNLLSIVDGEMSTINFSDTANTYTANAIAGNILEEAEEITILLENVENVDDVLNLITDLAFGAATSTDIKPVLRETVLAELKGKKNILFALNSILNSYQAFLKNKTLTNLNNLEVGAETKKYLSDTFNSLKKENKDAILVDVENAVKGNIAKLMQQSNIATYVDQYQNGQKKGSTLNIENNLEGKYTLQSIMSKIKTYFKVLKKQVDSIGEISVLSNNIFFSDDILLGTTKKDGVKEGDDIKGYSRLNAGETTIYNSIHMFFKQLFKSEFSNFGLDLMVASDKSTNYALFFNGESTAIKNSGIVDKELAKGNEKLKSNLIEAHKSYFENVGKNILNDYNTALGTNFKTIKQLKSHIDSKRYPLNEIRDLFISNGLEFFERFHYETAKVGDAEYVTLNELSYSNITGNKNKNIYTIDDIDTIFEQAIGKLKAENLDLSEVVMNVSKEQGGFTTDLEDEKLNKELFRRYFYTWAYLSEQFMMGTQGSVYQFKGATLAQRFVDQIKRNVLPGASNAPYLTGLVEGVADYTKTAIVFDPKQKMFNILGQKHDHERFDGASWEFEEQAILQDNSLGGVLGTSAGLHHKSIGQSMEAQRGVMSMLKHAAHRQTNEQLRQAMGSEYSPYKLKQKAFRQIPINFTLTEDHIKLVGDTYYFDVKKGAVVKKELKTGTVYNNLWDLWVDLGGAYSVKPASDGKYLDANNNRYSYTTYEDMDTSSVKLMNIIIANEYAKVKDPSIISLKNKFIGRITFKSGMKTGAGNINTVEEVFGEPELQVVNEDAEGIDKYVTEDSKSIEEQIESIEKRRLKEHYDYDMSLPEGNLIWQGIDTVSGFENTDEYKNKVTEINAKYDKEIEALNQQTTQQPTIEVNNESVVKITKQDTDKINEATDVGAKIVTEEDITEEMKGKKYASKEVDDFTLWYPFKDFGFINFGNANTGSQLDATKEVDGKMFTLPTQHLNATAFGGQTQELSNNIFRAVADLALFKLSEVPSIEVANELRAFGEKLLKESIYDSDFKSYSDIILKEKNINLDHGALFNAYVQSITSFFDRKAIKIKLPGTEYVVSSNSTEVYDVVMDGKEYVMIKPEIDEQRAFGKEITINNGPRPLAQQEFFFIDSENPSLGKQSARNLSETKLMVFLRNYKDGKIDKNTLLQEIDKLQKSSGVTFHIVIDDDPNKTYNKGKVLQRNKLTEIYENQERYEVETRPAEVGMSLTQAKKFGVKKDMYLSEIDINHFIDEVLKKEDTNVVTDEIRAQAEKMQASWNEYMRQIGGRIPGQGHQSIMGIKIAYITHDQKNTIYLPTESKWYKGEDEDIDKEPVLGYMVGSDGLISWNNEMDIRVKDERWNLAPVNATEEQIINWFVYNMNRIVHHPSNKQYRETETTVDPLKKVAKNSPKGNLVAGMSHLSVIDREVNREGNMVGKDVIGIVATVLKGFSALTSSYNGNPNSAYLIVKDGQGKAFKFNGKEYPLLANANWKNADSSELSNIATELLNTDLYKDLTVEQVVSKLKQDLDLQDDAVETLSQLLSAATDNAKELILDKLNITVQTAGMFGFLLSIDVPFKDVADFFIRPEFQFVLDSTKKNIFKGDSYVGIEDIINGVLEEEDVVANLKTYLKVEKLSNSSVKFFEDFKSLFTAGKSFRKLGELLSLNQGLPNTAASMVMYEKKFSEFIKEFVPDFNFNKYILNNETAERYIQQYEENKTGFNILFVLKNVPHFATYLELYGKANDIHNELSSKYKLLSTVVDELVERGYIKNYNAINDITANKLVGFIDQIIVDNFLRSKNYSFKTKKNNFNIAANKEIFVKWFTDEFFKDIKSLYKGQPFISSMSKDKSKRFKNLNIIRPTQDTTGLTDEETQTIVDTLRNAYNDLDGLVDSKGNNIQKMIEIYNLITTGDGNTKESLSKFYPTVNEYATLKPDINTIMSDIDNVIEYLVISNNKLIPNKKSIEKNSKADDVKPKYTKSYNEIGLSYYMLDPLTNEYESVELQKLNFYQSIEGNQVIEINNEVIVAKPERNINLENNRIGLTELLQLLETEGVEIINNYYGNPVSANTTLEDMIQNELNCDPPF
jgi:hypothetical protein